MKLKYKQGIEIAEETAINSLLELNDYEELSKRTTEDNVVLASEVKASGSNQIVGVHSPAPKNKTLERDKKSQGLVFHGGELLDKIKFGSANPKNKHTT